MDGLIDDKATDLSAELQESEKTRAKLLERSKFQYRENKRFKKTIEKLILDKNNLKQDLNRLAQENQKLKKRTKSILEKLDRVQELEQENKELKEELAREKEKQKELAALKAERSLVISKYEEARKQIAYMVEIALAERYDLISRLKGLIRDIPVDYKDIEKKMRLANRAKHRTGKNAQVALFVDVQNMFYSAKNLYNGRLDYEKFLETTVGDRTLVQATAYIVQTPDIDQTKFISLLKSIGYVVRTMDLKTGTGGFAKGNWDVGMTIDILNMIDKVDALILATGDGDFVPIVKLFQKRGVRVEIVSFAYNTAIDLKEIADRFYPITEELLIQDSSNNYAKNQQEKNQPEKS
ncbi:MAG: NYN domain-containing protein [bacterium]